MKGLIAFVVSIVVSIAAPLRAGDIQVDRRIPGREHSHGHWHTRPLRRSRVHLPGEASPSSLASSDRATATGAVCTPGSVVTLDARVVRG